MQNLYTTRQDSIGTNLIPSIKDSEVQKTNLKETLYYILKNRKKYHTFSILLWHNHDQQVHLETIGSFNDYVNWEYEGQEQDQ